MKTETIANKPIRVLLAPTPPDEKGATASGVVRYLYELSHSMGPEVEYVYLEEPVGAETSHPSPSWHAGVPEVEASGCRRLPRWRRRWMRLPATVALILGYSRDIWRLSRRMRKFRGKVDLVHCVADGCEIHNIAARLAGFPRIVSTVQALYGMEDYAQHWFRRLIEWLSFHSADKYIVVSDATWEGWHPRVGLKKEKTVTIYNAMTPPDYSAFDRAAYRQKLGISPDTVVFGICARLHRMKGHTYLLQAFAQLLKDEHSPPSPLRGEGRGEGDRREPRMSTPATLLLIAGDGPERQAIEAQIKALGLGAHVSMLGHWTDPLGFAAAIDVNVQPSIEMETIGFQNIEAMFAGVPSIVSDFGGAKEIIGKSGGGKIVLARDISSLHQAMYEYLRDANARKLAGDNASSFALETLTASTMSNSTIGVYKWMVVTSCKDRIVSLLPWRFQVLLTTFSRNRAHRIMINYLRKLTDESTQSLNIVKVGANDGISYDPVFEQIMLNARWRGLLIEPVPFIFERLKENYFSTNRFEFAQIAVGPIAGKMKFYYVSEDAFCHVAGLPNWFSQLGSFCREHIVKHLGKNIEPYIVESLLDVKPLDDVIEQYGVLSIDLLQIDTEGADYKVMQSLNLSKYAPRAILIEIKHLLQFEQHALKYLLNKNQYNLFDCGDDIFAVHKPAFKS